MSEDFVYKHLPDLTSVTPTICHLLGVAYPKLSTDKKIHTIIRRSVIQNGSDKVKKCLIFCPDALGLNFINRHTELFNPLFKTGGITLPVCSMFPPKTPVCFASMFTGAPPSVHGIKKYERPVLKCDTLFDALTRAGKKVAIAAVQDSSMDIIFRGRDLDYYSEKDDNAVTEQTLELLRMREHDIIVAYQQEYDDILHQKGHESTEAIAAAGRHLTALETITDAWNKYWSDFDRLLVYAPDHGAHSIDDSAISDHGELIPDDMIVYHSYWFGNKITLEIQKSPLKY